MRCEGGDADEADEAAPAKAAGARKIMRVACTSEPRCNLPRGQQAQRASPKEHARVCNVGTCGAWQGGENTGCQLRSLPATMPTRARASSSDVILEKAMFVSLRLSFSLKCGAGGSRSCERFALASQLPTAGRGTRFDVVDRRLWKSRLARPDREVDWARKIATD